MYFPYFLLLSFFLGVDFLVVNNTNNNFNILLKKFMRLIRRNISLSVLATVLSFFLIGFIFAFLDPTVHFMDPFIGLLNTVYSLFGAQITDIHDEFPHALRNMGDGALLTFRISVTSILAGFTIAIILAVILVTPGKVFGLKYIAQSFVDFFRSTPILVQLYLVYLGLPSFYKNVLNDQFPIRPLEACIIALTLNTAAYQTEIIRSGILAIPVGQTEASRALGLNSLQTMRYVILPQALRIIIPPYTNEIIQLLLNSSIASVIGVYELTRAGEDFSNQHLLFEPILFIALLYFIIAYSMARLTKLAEIKLRIPGLGVAHD